MNKKNVSPQQQFTSTNWTVFTSETIHSKRCSPAKGRLDFDGSEMTPSDIPTSDENTTGYPSEDDAFDFDLPNLDCLAEFLLGDFDDVKTVKSTGLGYETCDADQIFPEELAFT
ncbi:hypothetical protein Tco_1558431 [Tanacetum coccineum]